ncbi:hypothetical protein F5X99DRAFT_322371 [Biscogniauxia marginata]|nr:hypothetical protein F5X99DRAFT_322371 [Biscogniauxia marginata]
MAKPQTNVSSKKDSIRIQVDCRVSQKTTELISQKITTNRDQKFYLRESLPSLVFCDSEPHPLSYVCHVYFCVIGIVYLRSNIPNWDYCLLMLSLFCCKINIQVSVIQPCLYSLKTIPGSPFMKELQHPGHWAQLSITKYYDSVFTYVLSSQPTALSLATLAFRGLTLASIFFFSPTQSPANSRVSRDLKFGVYYKWIVSPPPLSGGLRPLTPEVSFDIRVRRFVLAGISAVKFRDSAFTRKSVRKAVFHSHMRQVVSQEGMCWCARRKHSIVRRRGGFLTKFVAFPKLRSGSGQGLSTRLRICVFVARGVKGLLLELYPGARGAL